jgi:general secretion pathway protein L
VTGALVVALPEVAVGASADTHWWLIAGGAVKAAGVDADWTGLALARPEPALIGLAPSGAARLIADRTARDGVTPTQAAAVARLDAIEHALGDAETLHAVSGADGDRIVTAIVSNAAMMDWIDWGRAAGVEFDRIVPTALLFPGSDTWSSLSIGDDHLTGRGDVVLPNEPALVEAVAGAGPIADLGPEDSAAAVLRAAGPLPLNLRSGRFGKRRRFLLQRARLRELAILALLIVLITLAWAIVSIVKLHRSSDALDRSTLAIAQAALGRPVTLESAEAELAQGRATARLAVPLAALYQALQAEPSVTSTQIGYTAGNFSATLAAPSSAEVNRILLALQRDGYRVTAVPRQSPDGRAMTDLTIRTGP